jgi:AraC-like DNA-binding protein
LTETRGLGPVAADVLSSVLRSVRLSGSVQFCFMPTGRWQTDAAPSLAGLTARPSGVMPFHIVAAGACWLKLGDQRLDLVAGDVVAFPFGAGHQLGAGEDGRLVTPVRDLPPKPWADVPVLRYGDGEDAVRLLCGYLEFGAVNFQPLRGALPDLIHVRTAADPDLGWLGATLAQIVAEVDRPRAGGASVLERLTEITFIELLRRHVAAAPAGSAGWLAAMRDPALARCLGLIHAEPMRDWSVSALAAGAGLSRSALAERFETVLATSPMRYVRSWRLCLAGVALSTSDRPVALIAYEAGYGAEAAFNRAFSRAHGMPPAAWRALGRQAEPSGGPYVLSAPS